MKNTEIKDFNVRVKVGQKVTITYDGNTRTFDNRKNCNQSLWQMCEDMVLNDLQDYWDDLDYIPTDDSENLELYKNKERQLMNRCKIKFH